jgi:hypothetical protein
MDKNYQNWMLIIEKGSQFTNINGAYQLKSIMNCKEMAILPKFPGR